MVGGEPTGCTTPTHYPGTLVSSHIWDLIGQNLVGILAGAEPPHAPCESSVPTSSKSSDEIIDKKYSGFLFLCSGVSASSPLLLLLFSCSLTTLRPYFHPDSLGRVIWIVADVGQSSWWLLVGASRGCDRMYAGKRLARRSALICVFCCSTGPSVIGSFSSSFGIRFADPSLLRSHTHLHPSHGDVTDMVHFALYV
jgi:hypothetical protein